MGLLRREEKGRRGSEAVGGEEPQSLAGNAMCHTFLCCRRGAQLRPSLGSCTEAPWAVSLFLCAQKYVAVSAGSMLVIVRTTWFLEVSLEIESRLFRDVL